MNDRYHWSAEHEDTARRERREQFESYAEGQGLDLAWETLAYSKFYKSKPTRVAWHAWEAALLRAPMATAAPRRNTDLKFRCRHCGRSSDTVPLHLTCPYCVVNAANSYSPMWPYGSER